MANKLQMFVPTPEGTITVQKATDPNYPGLVVSINGTDLAVIEYDESIGKHVIRVWDHREPDGEPDYVQTLFNTKFEGEKNNG